MRREPHRGNVQKNSPAFGRTLLEHVGGNRRTQRGEEGKKKEVKGLKRSGNAEADVVVVAAVGSAPVAVGRAEAP